jgi:hypothetical protein
MHSHLVITLALLLVSARVSAQRDQPHEEEPMPREQRYFAEPLALNLGGVLALPVGSSSARFDPGGGFSVGLTYTPHPFVGVQAEYLYSYHDVEGDVLDIRGLDGNHKLQYGDLNVVLRPLRSGPFGLYVVGGPGIYHRSVELSNETDTGVGTFCDPLLLFCYPGTVPASEVLGSQTSLDFGVNAGLGVYLWVAPPLRMYLEARYHYIWGPSFRGENGETQHANAEYIPAVLGLGF